MNRKKDGYHHGALREALIDRAIEHLAAGMRVIDLSVRSLAAEIGVSKGAPYRHFPSAEALIAAVAARGFLRLAGCLRSVEKPSLAAIGTAYVRFAAANPDLYRAMFYFPAEEIAAFPELEEAAGQAFAVLQNSLSASSVPNQILSATAAWAYVHGLAELVINRLTMQLDVNDDETMNALMSRFDPVIS